MSTWVTRTTAAACAACAVLALSTAGSAGALPPDHLHFEDSGSFPHFVECDGFEIGLDTEGTFDVTVFFDAAGDVSGFLVAARAIDTFTNSVTGKVVVNRGVFEERFTRIEGTDEFSHSLVGFRFIGTSPGEGLVLQDVGRIVYSPGEEEILFLAGQHHVPDDSEDLFCAALS